MRDAGEAKSKEEPRSIPDDWLFVDVETGRGGGAIASIGAVRGGKEVRVDHPTPANALPLLDLADGARVVIGHNFWRHDRGLLERVPHLRAIAGLPALDTLELSSLFFPERPYHALVKGEKLARASKNDPVADCRETLEVLLDVIDRMRQHARRAPQPKAPGEAGSTGGVSASRDALGGGMLGRHHGFVLAALAQRAGDRDAVLALAEHAGVPVPTWHEATRGLGDWRPIACLQELRDLAVACRDGSADAVAAAHVVAWLSTAGTRSIVPVWASRQHTSVFEWLGRLREVSCAQETCRWCTANHRPESSLEKWYGFTTFRAVPAAPDGSSLQRAIVDAALRGKSLFAVLPTGGGKSLCFQLPALVRAERTGALTVIVSPLQSLMKDQVDNLREQGGDAAVVLSGMLNQPERADALERIRDGRASMVYLSPEQLRGRTVRSALAARRIAAWVFDEAHCLAKWGHDFRPDYLYAPKFIRKLADEQHAECPPVSCFTATAQREVIAETCEVVREHTGHKLEVFNGGVERTNLAYKVERVGGDSGRAKRDALLEWIQGFRSEGNGSAVVFCATRADTEDVAKLLTAAGLDAKAYHAGLESHDRRKIQDEFVKAGDGAIIVATNAFGMGVDKPDVRLVVHYAIPGSLENYVQEAGRAGRDGKESTCVLLFEERDVDRQFGFLHRSKLSYADMASLRRAIVKTAKRVRGRQARSVVVTGRELARYASRSFGGAIEEHDVTRVTSAVAWLERAKHLERTENVTRMFQGVPALDAAAFREKVDRLGLSDKKRALWDRLFNRLNASEADELVSTDDLVQAAGLATGDGKPAEQHREVLGALADMVEQGIVQAGETFTAFARFGGDACATTALKDLSKLDRELFRALAEQAPDLAKNGAALAHISALHEHLCGRLGDTCTAARIRALLRSAGDDDDGYVSSAPSLQTGYRGRDAFELRLRHDGWQPVQDQRQLFFAVAGVVLRVIQSKAATARGGEHLVAFKLAELDEALRDLTVASRLKARTRAALRALKLLHDTQIITLQNGLAVFYQAMTLELPEHPRPLNKQRDYAPVEDHFARRTTQVHVMAEYARVGAENRRDADELAHDWFALDEKEFLRKRMPGRAEELKRMATKATWEALVRDLHDDAQQAIVEAPVDRNQLVLAGPGTGKTRVVVHRIAWLVRGLGVEASGIFAVAYNRAAAHEIRRRLAELMPDDARFVRVHTVHGLAARVLGRAPGETTTSERLRATADGDGAPDSDRFVRLLDEATRSLVDEDGTRHAELFGGCTHLLVDEYQDIDAHQAAFLRAVAGRLRRGAPPAGDVRVGGAETGSGEPADEADDLAGRKSRLTLLAVGDDDQAIYGFAGADTRFIASFAEEFGAERRMLLRNYRSVPAIVDVANHVIESAPSRLKAGSPIVAVRMADASVASQGSPPAVRWVQCHDDASAAHFVAHELALRGGHAGGRSWLRDKVAVLAGSHRQIGLVRGACEELGVPTRHRVTPKESFVLERVRELCDALADLADRKSAPVKPSQLRALWLSGSGSSYNPWHALLAREVDAWTAEYGSDTELAPALLRRELREALADERYACTLGDGAMLSTLHAAKGLEFGEAYVLPQGDWKTQDPVEALRLFYVGVTRAQHRLTVVTTTSTAPGLCATLTGAPNVHAAVYEHRGGAAAVEYRVLSLSDLNLDWAAQSHLTSALPRLEYGTPVRLSGLAVDASGGNTEGRIEVADGRAWRQIARLSKSAAESLVAWQGDTIEGRVLAAHVRHRGDSVKPGGLVRETWELPIVELRLPSRG